MAPGTDDPKDLGSKKMNNREKESNKNEGFSGENLPNNYDPSQGDLNTEIEKDKAGNVKTEQRARSVDEENAKPVTQTDKAESNGKIVDKSRGTSNEAEAMETAENRDFNSDLEENRYPAGHPENKKQRGDANPGE